MSPLSCKNRIYDGISLLDSWKNAVWRFSLFFSIFLSLSHFVIQNVIYIFQSVVKYNWIVFMCCASFSAVKRVAVIGFFTHFQFDDKTWNFWARRLILNFLLSFIYLWLCFALIWLTFYFMNISRTSLQKLISHLEINDPLEIYWNCLSVYVF